MQTRKRIHNYKNACQKKDDELLANIHARWPELNELLKEVNSHKIGEALKNIAPRGTTLCPMFKELYQAGAPAMLPSGWAALLCLYNLR